MQEVDLSAIPSEVINAFEKAHPSTNPIAWEKEGDYYEIEYLVNDLEQSWIYDKSGALVGKEEELPVGDLPGVISAYLSANYGAYSVEAFEKVSLHGQEKLAVEIRQKDREMELIFDRDGNFLELEAEDADAEDDRS